MTSSMRFAVTLLAGCTLAGAAGVSAAATSDMERGGYLVRTFGCADCHAPLRAGPTGARTDLSRGLSGHPQEMTLPPPPAPQGPWVHGGSATNTAFYGPWGISYAANVTPDKNTGLGVWTEDMFLKAMRTGKHMGTSRAIQPPMPWPWIGRATDADLKAIFAYLKSVPPVSNHVPDYSEPKSADSAESGKKTR